MQTGFFDYQERLDLLEHLGDPLPGLERAVDWEGFRAALSKVYKTSTPQTTPLAGRQCADQSRRGARQKDVEARLHQKE